MRWYWPAVMNVTEVASTIACREWTERHIKYNLLRARILTFFLCKYLFRETHLSRLQFRAHSRTHVHTWCSVDKVVSRCAKKNAAESKWLKWLKRHRNWLRILVFTNMDPNVTQKLFFFSELRKNAWKCENKSGGAKFVSGRTMQHRNDSIHTRTSCVCVWVF